MTPEKLAEKPANVIEIRGRYDPSAAVQISNLPVPDYTPVVLDGLEIGTVGEVRQWTAEYEKVISRNPLRKRSKKNQSRDWLRVK